MITKSIQFVCVALAIILLSGCGGEAWGPGTGPTLPPPTDTSYEPPVAFLPTDTSAVMPTNTMTPTVVASVNLCDNPYWPISDGAYWIYVRSDPGVPDSQVKKTIHDIVYSPDEVSFTLSEEMVGGSGSNGSIFHCTREGIFLGTVSILPFNQAFQDGPIYNANGQKTANARIEQITVPAGTFDVVTLFLWVPPPSVVYSFAKGIGPVRYELYNTGDNLVSYYIP